MKRHLIISSLAVAGCILSSITGYAQDLANFTGSLSGKYPGLTVIRTDATPGSGSARMLIRGIGSYAQGSDVNTLKIFVDGFEVQADFINYLSPEEIESVTICKNAQDLALFGMNGADGVILITTRRGMESAPKINFRMRGGVQTPINVVKPLGSLDYANLYNQAWSNDHGREWDPYYDFEAINAYKAGQGVDVNWYDEVFKSTASYADASLSIRGGSAKARYSVLLDYANQQGFLNVRNTDRTHNVAFVKYGVRTNLDMKLNDIFTVSVDLGGRLEDRFRPNYSVYQLVSDVMHYPSNIYPILDSQATDPISTFSGTAVYPNNPVASLAGVGWTTSRTKLMQANFKFREDFGFLLPGLYMQEGFSFYSRTVGNTAKTRSYARYYQGVPQTADQSTYIRSNGYWSSGKERWMQGNVLIGWNGDFDKHHMDATLGFHISDFNGSGSAFYNWKYRYVNFTALVNYSYDRRFEASAGLSYFGSDAYAPGKRFVPYPSIGLGWRPLENLKIRGSAGITGATEANVDINGFTTGGRYLYQQYYTWTGSFVTGMGPSFDGGVSGIRPLFKSNENVTAERSIKGNLGFETTLWNMLSITADYFIDYRSGILTQDRTLMDYQGEQTAYSNLGKMLNQGVDAHFVLGRKDGAVDWSVTGSFLFARNKVLEMGEVATKYPYNASTGLPYATRMGLECIGFYNITDFDLDGDLNMGLPVPLFGSVQPGDLKYKDQDGDGYIDETDIVRIGNPAYPMASFSLGGQVALYGFDFSFLLTGSFGSSVNLLDYDAWKPFLNYGSAFEWAKGAWVYYPEAKLDTRQTATYPRLSTGQNDHNYRPSSFWVRDNTYLRLQEVELGYSIPFKEGSRIDQLRIYLSGCNLLTLSSLLRDYKMDPETVNYGYPAARSFNLGLQISF
ncbi:MAG: SusC/RagA family TonB-linked outer membrane protein [Bacteroidales bacterium]|nr:SusC/RagA family TonB-linked outer membrane protein [Bacteroidales bacterium]